MNNKIEYLSDEGLRVDGRRYNELRQIKGRLGTIKQMDGSAYLEQGNTKILVTVAGPKETRSVAEGPTQKCRLDIHWNTASFSTPERRKKILRDRKTSDWVTALKESLETAIMAHLIPNSQVDISVNILQSDGSVAACAINATTLALIDAGIPMVDFLCACSVGFVKDMPLIDINLTEESSRCPHLTLAGLPRSGKIALMHLDSKIPLEKSKLLFLAAKTGAFQVYEALSALVRERNASFYRTHSATISSYST